MNGAAQTPWFGQMLAGPAGAVGVPGLPQQLPEGRIEYLV